MKKLFTCAVAMLSLTLGLVGMAACNDQTGSPSDHEHVLVEHPATDPTCTAAGNEHYWECSDCGKTFADEAGQEEFGDYTISATGHDYGDPDWSWKQGADGYTASVAFECSVCDDKQTIVAEVTHEGTDAECEEDGAIVYTAHATFKGDSYDDTKTVVLPATGHTYDRKVVDEKYHVDGETYRYSCKCGEFEADGETFEAHVLTKVDGVDPTCEEDGSAEYWHCSTCNKDFTSEEAAEEITEVTIPATGHDYGDPVWSWADDHTSATATFTCANCDDEHEVTATVTTTTTETTCVVLGNTTYTAAAEFGGEEYTDVQVIEAEELAEHEWSEDWETDEFKHRHVCANCDTTKDEDWHTGGTATATDKAVCEVCNTAYGDILPSYDGENKLTIDSGKAKLTGSATHNGIAIEAITAGVTITFEFNVETAGEVMLVLNGTHVGDAIEGGFKITINDEEQEELLDVAPTATWYNAAKISTYKTTLQPGKNVVVFTAMEGTANVVNVYSLEVGSVAEEGEEDDLPTYVGGEALIISPSEATLTGSGNLQGSFIGGTANNSTVVTYTFYSKAEEEVELILAIANGRDTYNDAFSVKINDGEAFLMDAETSGANQWGLLIPRTVKTMTLSANTKYTVEFSLLDGGGTINIGYFKVAPTASPEYEAGKTMTFGASSVTPQNGCDTQGHAAGYDGSIVGNINAAGRGVLLTFNSKDATTAHLTVFTDGDNNSNVTFEVIVNGTSAGTCTYSANGWTNFNFARDAGNISLVQGENTVEIRLAAGSASMNFSHLILSPATAD